MKLTDWTQELKDLSDTAALAAALDLVVTVDTSVAHVAAAIGTPVWLLLPFAPDWRWMLDRDDTPWYPAMRLFRQSRLHDWSSVVARVAAALVEIGDVRAVGHHRGHALAGERARHRRDGASGGLVGAARDQPRALPVPLGRVVRSSVDGPSRRSLLPTGAGARDHATHPDPR